MELILGLAILSFIIYCLIGIDLPIDADLIDAHDFEKKQAHLSHILGGRK